MWFGINMNIYNFLFRLNVVYKCFDSFVLRKCVSCINLLYIIMKVIKSIIFYYVINNLSWMIIKKFILNLKKNFLS